MKVLADAISIESRYARSANLERDADRPEPLDGYIITARALDVVERVATVAATGSAGGAWSLTGPYGSGKSSLALLLDAAFGEEGETRQVALDLIGEASDGVCEQIQQAHDRHETRQRGFNRGLVTADREPISNTVLRALRSAVIRRYGKIPSANQFQAVKTLRGAIKDSESTDLRRSGPSPAALLEIARCLAQDAPLLLVVDEFGKNLEAIRDGGDTDPYLLQQLAEAGQGSGMPIFVLTLQHLSFEDCLAGADDAQRKEWAKVQGRFEDVAFVESPTQTRALIGTVFKVADDKLKRRIERWAKAKAEQMRFLGVAEMADPKVVESCYPLHPLAALVLPDLCSRYGQHERTLFSFLAGPGPSGASSFLSDTVVSPSEPLPSLGLDSVYDYFVANDALGVGRTSRWTEIASRIRDSHGLSLAQERLAKAIAILNLVATSGTIRASREFLEFSHGSASDTLAELQGIGLVTYRDFVDEYRIWQGTDVDVHGIVEVAQQKVRLQPLVEILSEIDLPRPVVAARHSSENNILRVFTRRYCNGDEPVEPLDASSPFDGEVVLVADAEARVPSLAPSSIAAKPVVAAIPADVSELAEAAYEVGAIIRALDDPAVVEDWVARRELSERLAQARKVFEHSAEQAFRSDSCKWFLIGEDNSEELQGGRGSVAISSAADMAYPYTPTVHNEMLNRTDLTSQGAKARRILLEAMIEHGDEPRLGLEGYGPEMAMYRAFLEITGIHGHDQRNSRRVFRKPEDKSLRPAWDVLQDEFERAKGLRVNLRDVYAALQLPPIGMKVGVVPVFVTAGLLACADSVALYEHGTFKPLLTPEISERMVRNPGHFDIKHFANTTGARRQVIDKLAGRLNVRPSFRKHRVANVLSIVGHLVSHVRRLDNYTLRTANLSEATLSARDALLEAVEPDELLFGALPRALGFRAVPSTTATYKNARAYADSVGKVLDELATCYDRLLTELFNLVLGSSAETTRLAVCGQAAALEGEVLDPEVRAFVLALGNDSVESDADWINAIATVVARKTPAEWADDDYSRFSRELPEQVAAFHRLTALHADRRAQGGGPFDAYRMTITRSDGSEHVRLLAVDHEQRAQVDQAIDEAVEDVARLVGSPQRAHQALLARLGERLMPPRHDLAASSNAMVQDGEIEAKATHG